MKVKIMRVERCSRCGGHGIHYGSGEYGDIVDCSECGGGGVVQMRDERGRFVPWEEIEVEETDEETA